MKKYFALAAIAALTLASCAKVDTYKVVENEDAIIAFSNYSPKAITRADADNYATSTTLIANADFDVYGWSTANGTSFTGSNGTKFFAASAPAWYTVTYKTDGNSDGSKNAYPDGYRYWPSGDTPDYLSFYAYYPSNAGTISAPDGLGAFTFTAEAAAADQVDFMVADVVKDQVYDATNSGTNGTVALTFKHMLTKVQFKFKKATGLGATTVIELVDAELAGINNAGTLTATYTQNASPAVNALGTTDYVWSAQSGAAGYEVFVNTANPENGSAIVLTESASTVADADIFLMVPQTIAAATQKLNVTWNVKVYDTAAHATANGAEGLLSSTPNSAELSFYDDLKVSDTDDTAASAIQWARNSFITYTITIGPKPIWFTASVEGWAAEQNGYFNAQ